MHASNNSLENELSDDPETDEENAQENGLDNKTLLVTLMKQINLLYETNTKIFRNLHETKGKSAELGLVCLTNYLVYDIVVYF